MVAPCVVQDGRRIVELAQPNQGEVMEITPLDDGEKVDRIC